MGKALGIRWLVVVAGAAMVLALAAACGETKTIEVPGETVVVKEEVIKEVMVPGETVTVTKEVVKEVMVPGETVIKEVVKEVAVPGETVVIEVEQEVVKTVEVPGETVVVTKEVIKEVAVPGETVVVTKEVVKVVEVAPDRYVRNVWGELVDRPQYGGTITVALPFSPTGFDPYFGGFAVTQGKLVYEKLGRRDWAISRDEHDFTTQYFLIDSLTGHLAESWEQPDPLTIIFHIRQGVNWHDKAPMNGREFNANDVEFTWHRSLGLGSGYTEPSPTAYHAKSIREQVESVTATDEWTVVVKTPSFSPSTIEKLLWRGWQETFILPPEVIKEHGDLKDWKTIVGTGPYELTDFVEGSALIYTKNPNYWGFDPRYPDLDLRLPYADKLELLIMPELSTRVAAIRSGKSAWLSTIGLPLDQALSVLKTNPELVALRATGDSVNPGFLLNRPPFNDKNVRIAMQKALNLDEIARTYYGGYADPTPVGCAPQAATGIYLPYADWPEQVKEQYTYDPNEAERLLDEAGYPRDADGIRFTTTWLIMPVWEDVDLAQLAKSYFAEIGVDTNIEVESNGGAWEARVSGRDVPMYSLGCRHANHDPMAALKGRFYSGGDPDGAWGNGLIDPTYDAIVDKNDGGY